MPGKSRGHKWKCPADLVDFIDDDPKNRKRKHHYDDSDDLSDSEYEADVTPSPVTTRRKSLKRSTDSNPSAGNTQKPSSQDSATRTDKAQRKAATTGHQIQTNHHDVVNKQSRIIKLKVAPEQLQAFTSRMSSHTSKPTVLRPLASIPGSSPSSTILPWVSVASNTTPLVEIPFKVHTATHTLLLNSQTSSPYSSPAPSTSQPRFPHSPSPSSSVLSALSSAQSVSSLPAQLLAITNSALHESSSDSLHPRLVLETDPTKIIQKLLSENPNLANELRQLQNVVLVAEKMYTDEKKSSEGRVKQLELQALQLSQEVEEMGEIRRQLAESEKSRRATADQFNEMGARIVSVEIERNQARLDVVSSNRTAQLASSRIVVLEEKARNQQEELARSKDQCTQLDKSLTLIEDKVLEILALSRNRVSARVVEIPTTRGREDDEETNFPNGRAEDQQRISRAAVLHQL